MTIEVGDIVKIKTGNTEMTVLSLQRDKAECHYVDSGNWDKPTTQWFPLAVLVKVEAEASAEESDSESQRIKFS